MSRPADERQAALQLAAAWAAVKALRGLVVATKCYCLDYQESVMAGVCGHCEGIIALHLADLSGLSPDDGP